MRNRFSTRLRQLSLTPLAFITVGLLLESARADFYLHRWEDQHETVEVFRLAPELTYYQSKSNYDSEGTLKIPGTFDKYLRYELDLVGAYGIVPGGTLYGRLAVARAKVNDGILPNPPARTALADQTLGFNYRLLDPRDSSPAIDLQLQLDFPAYDNRSASLTGDLYMGDATTDVTIGGFATLPISHRADGNWEILAGLGITKRTDSFVSGMPWSFDLERRPFGKGVRFGLGLFGYQGIQSEETTSARVISTPVNQGNGRGTFIINSPKPSHIDIRAQLGMDFDPRMGAYLAYQQTITGSAAPNGFLLSLGLNIRFGKNVASAPRSVDPFEATAEEFGRSNKGFVSYGLTAKVLKTNDRLNLVKIDKGSGDGVEVGQVYDIFSVKMDGSAEHPVARARVSAINSSGAVLQVVEFYKEVWIDEGFIAKRAL